MMLLLRLVAVIAAVIIVLPVVRFYLSFSLHNVPGEARTVVHLLSVIGVVWFLWVNLTLEYHGALSRTILGALLLGSLGFWYGFVPEPNTSAQPLVGFFLTGPLGFLLGGIAGFLYWRSEARKT